MSPKADQSQLFVVRLWREDSWEESLEYRGRVQHVLSGETHHFRTWSTLIEFLITQSEEVQVVDDPNSI